MTVNRFRLSWVPVGNCERLRHRRLTSSSLSLMALMKESPRRYTILGCLSHSTLGYWLSLISVTEWSDRMPLVEVEKVSGFHFDRNGKILVNNVES